MKEGIERRKNIQTILRVGIPGIWLICFPFIAGFFWILHEEMQISMHYAKFSILIGIWISFISFVSSFILPKETKSVVFAHLLGGVMVSALLALSVFFWISLLFYWRPKLDYTRNAINIDTSCGSSMVLAFHIRFTKAYKRTSIYRKRIHRRRIGHRNAHSTADQP